MTTERLRHARILLSLFALLIPARGAALQFRLPVENEGGRAIWSTWVIGVDHGAVTGDRLSCIDFLGRFGFPFCYDGHRGTDYLLLGAFETMDAGSAWVVAAADGVVTRVIDGNYDRCHGDLITGDITCHGHEQRSNTVIIAHDGGVETLYAHFMKHSIVVIEGMAVQCGDRLGLIGSSGTSAAPHLHFEVQDADGATIDPYAGTMSRPESFWVQENGLYGLPGEYCEGEAPPFQGADAGSTPDAAADVVETVAVAPDASTPDIAPPRERGDDADSDAHSADLTSSNELPSSPSIDDSRPLFDGGGFPADDVPGVEDLWQGGAGPAPPATRLPMGCMSTRPGEPGRAGLAMLLLGLLMGTLRLACRTRRG